MRLRTLTRFIERCVNPCCIQADKSDIISLIRTFSFVSLRIATPITMPMVTTIDYNMFMYIAPSENKLDTFYIHQIYCYQWIVIHFDFIGYTRVVYPFFMMGILFSQI